MRNDLGQHGQTHLGKGHTKDYFTIVPKQVSEQLGALLLQLADGEICIEKQRRQLCTEDLFKPYEAFTRIDRNGWGYITALEIARYLKELGVERSQQQCTLLTGYFDSEPHRHFQGSQLSYHE